MAAVSVITAQSEEGFMVFLMLIYYAEAAYTGHKKILERFLPREALCALRGIATVTRPSVRPSVCA